LTRPTITLVAGSQTSARRSISSTAVLALQPRLHDQKIGRDLAGVMFDGGLQAAQLHGHMRLWKAAVGGGALQRRARVGKFAKGVDGDARHRPLMRRSAEWLFAAPSTFRRRFAMTILQTIGCHVGNGAD
jgi:hypothetical protein